MGNNIPVLDATGTSASIKTTDTANVHVPHRNIDNTVTVSGSAAPAEKTMLQVSGSTDTGGANILVAAGATTRIVVSAFVMQNESSGGSNVMTLGSCTLGTRNLRIAGINQGDGLAMTFPAGRELKLAKDEALVFTIESASQCNYSAMYWTE